MANPFLSKKIIIPAIIFFGGLAVASGILISANLTAAQSFTTSQNSQWTQPTGEGISIPACFSSGGVNSTTCVGGVAQATLSWTSSHPVNLDVCRSFWCELIVYTPAGMYPGNNGWDAFTLPASGSVILSPLDSNTTYIYAFRDGTDMIAYPTFTTPNCAPPPPTATITASPTSIPYNTASTISWSSTNATSCTVSPTGWTGTSGSQSTGNLTSSQTYTVNCSGPGGAALGSAAVTVGGAPTASISADPTTINYSQSSTLNWSSTNATSCSIDQGIGGVPVNGSTSVSPATNTTYTITCSGPGASAQSSASVTVNQPPGDFNLSAGGGLACNSAPLSWTASAGATAYRILRGSPRVDISPYQPYTALNFTDTTVSQNTSYIYQIEAYNGAGTKRSNSINIDTPYCPPTLSFFGNPTSIYQGQSTTLTWSTSYATSCVASGAWSGSKAVSGSEVVIPSPPSATYTLTCTGPGGSTGPQSVIISITPLALPEWKEIIPR